MNIHSLELSKGVLKEPLLNDLQDLSKFDCFNYYVSY